MPKKKNRGKAKTPANVKHPAAAAAPEKKKKKVRRRQTKKRRRSLPETPPSGALAARGAFNSRKPGHKATPSSHHFSLSEEARYTSRKGFSAKIAYRQMPIQFVKSSEVYDPSNFIKELSNLLVKPSDIPISVDHSESILAHDEYDKNISADVMEAISIDVAIRNIPDEDSDVAEAPEKSANDGLGSDADNMNYRKTAPNESEKPEVENTSEKEIEDDVKEYHNEDDEKLLEIALAEYDFDAEDSIGKDENEDDEDEDEDENEDENENEFPIDLLKNLVIRDLGGDDIYMGSSDSSESSALDDFYDTEEESEYSDEDFGDSEEDSEDSEANNDDTEEDENPESLDISKIPIKAIFTDYEYVNDVQNFLLAWEPESEYAKIYGTCPVNVTFDKLVQYFLPEGKDESLLEKALDEIGERWVDKLLPSGGEEYVPTARMTEPSSSHPAGDTSADMSLITQIHATQYREDGEYLLVDWNRESPRYSVVGPEFVSIKEIYSIFQPFGFASDQVLAKLISLGYEPDEESSLDELDKVIAQANGELSDDEERPGIDNDSYSDPYELQNYDEEDMPYGDGLEDLVASSSSWKNSSEDYLYSDRVQIDRPRRKPKREQGPDFGSAGVAAEVADYLKLQWQKSREAKRLKKAEREKLRAQKKLGRRGKKDRLRQPAIKDLFDEYPEEMRITDCIKEVEWFLEDDEAQTLYFPPLDSNANRVIRELCRAYQLATKIQGNSVTKYSVIATKSKKTYGLVDQEYVEIFLKIRRSFQRADKGAGRSRERSIAKPRGGAPKVWLSEGQIVGAAAEEIGNENIGHQLLEKMGWSKGMGLGVTERSGIMEPILAKIKKSKSGLGA